jgi:hypothetical protein
MRRAERLGRTWDYHEYRCHCWRCIARPALRFPRYGYCRCGLRLCGVRLPSGQFVRRTPWIPEHFNSRTR